MNLYDEVGTEKPDIKWPKPSPPGAGASIGERVEYSLAEGVRRVLDLFDEPLSELLAWGFRLIIKVVEKSLGSYMKPALDHATKHMAPGDPLKDLFERLKEPTGEGAMGLLAGMGAGAGQAGLMSVFEPVFESWRQNAYLGRPTKIPDIGTLLMMYQRGAITDAQRDEWIQRNGYGKDLAWAIWDVLRPRPDIGTLGVLTQRGEVDPNEFINELKLRGYSDKEGHDAQTLLHIIPNVGDQIRMAVREAFDPATISKFGLHDEMHKVPFESLKKIGLDEEWAKAYWAAHWDLPSVSMGFEMLHRGVIDEAELKMLLATADITPFWREKLLEISYSPYTRVDVRRMYDMGILDEAGVLQSYIDLGYDPERARNMTAFTLAYYQEDERKASRTDIINAYVEGVISRGEAKGFLTDLGFQDIYTETYLIKADYTIAKREREDEEEDTEEEYRKERELTKADILSAYQDGIMNEGEAGNALKEIGYPDRLVVFLLAKTDFKRVQNLIREEIKTTKTLYVNEDIDLSEVHARLGKYALPATQIDELVTLWGMEKERRTERPSVSQLTTFYLNDVIDDTRLREQLSKHKLSSEYIDWFMAMANLNLLEREQKEEERIRKEQERIVASKFKTDRMVELNRLNVLIQELKVYIAELKVSALVTEEPEILEQIVQMIEMSKLEIARLQLTKVEYPVIPLEGS